jgi:hypothetical protein
VGQTEYVTPAHYMEIEHIWEGCKFCGHWDVAMAEAARGQWQSGLRWLTKRVLAVMDRDRRLTGYLRGQTDQALAPAGFEFTNGWRVSLLRDLISASPRVNLLTINSSGREACPVKTKLLHIHHGDGIR